MSNRLIQYGFSAGIVSETLWSQTILQKYGWGLSECENYIIEFSGILTSRAGMLADTILPILPGTSFRFVPFIFAQEDANTFGLLFTANRVYFLQQGRFQLEAGKTVLSATDGFGYTQFVINGHGYSVGDCLEFYGTDVPAPLVGQLVRVSAVVDVNTIQVQQIARAEGMDDWADAALTGVSAYRIYSISTPFTAADLPNLYFAQTRDVVDITSHAFPPMQLEREADGTWTLSTKDYEIDQPSPSGLDFDASNTGSAGTLFAITSVGANGEESLPSYHIADSIVDYSTTAGWVTFKWDSVSGTAYYNVYRSRITAQTQINYAFSVGFLGRTAVPKFTDSNIIPDFTTTPPESNNPFANSAITEIAVTAPGADYAVTDTLVITDSTGPGEGASAVLVIDNDTGEALGVKLLSGGKNYETPAASITTSTGSGATFSFSVGEASGNNPAVSASHHQRKVYASSANHPLTIWGSQIGLFDKFNTSSIVAANDSYEYELAWPILGVVKHILSTRSGMLVFTNIGIWTITGSETGTVTPTDIDADPQTSIGSSDLIPIQIDSDILYAEVRNRVIRLLQYNHYSRQFGGVDISTLARDLFSKWYDLTQWAYEPRPYKLVWSVRNDGQLLSVTIAQEQEVFAWGVHKTNGSLEAVITLPETTRDTTYTITSRRIGDADVLVLEHFADREKSVNEDHCGVDCAVQFGGEVRPNVAVTVAPAIDTLTEEELDAGSWAGSATTSVNFFTPADVGKYIKYREGKALITDYFAPTVVFIETVHDFTQLRVPYSTRYKPIPAGEWVFAELMDSFQLPLNYRPDKVTVFGDGKIFPDLIPDVSGVVTFPEELAFGYIGLNFDCLAATLPFAADGTIIEDSRKNVKGVGIRYKDSKGIEVGTSKTDTYPMEHYFHSNMAEATLLASGHEYIAISSDWDENTRVYLRANGAVPTQISGIVVDLEVGDDVD